MAGTQPRWHILGVGAIGSLWATAFCASSQSVTLLLHRQSSLQRYRQCGGITLDTAHAHYTFAPPAFVASAYRQPIEHLLLTTKTYQTLAALQSIESVLVENATVLLVQNGLGLAEQLLNRWPKLQLWLGLSTDGVRKTGDFHYRRAGVGSTQIGGVSTDLQPSEILKKLPSELLTLQADTDILRSSWRKLAINCVINPLTTIHKCQNGALLQQPELAQQIPLLCEEISLVAGHYGLALSTAELVHSVREVARTTASNTSSMLQDVLDGRPTEVNAITGYLITKAQAKGLAVPLHQQLMAAVIKISPLSVAI